MKKILVTGGNGFIGSSLVKRLVCDGHQVRVLDNNSRGLASRLDAVRKDIEFVQGDICHAATVERALDQIDVVHHLAYVNGTENFYRIPERVLEVAVKGMINVLDGCIAKGVPEIFLASSSEVYQLPPRIPADESVPLVVPDVLNPRFSYGGGKIICELLTVNYGRKYFDRVCLYRPHNIYGPDMGWEHVIPQFSKRLYALAANQPESIIDFPIQGSGSETRSFCYIEDFMDGVALLQEHGEHLGIYHIGTLAEVTMASVAERVAKSVKCKVRIVPGERLDGSVERRCPDISRMKALGYLPRVSLDEGIKTTVEWYWEELSRLGDMKA